MSDPTPSAGQVVAQAFAILLQTILGATSATREQAMVLTKLDEAEIWAARARER